MTRLEEIEKRMAEVVEESRSAEGDTLDKLLEESEKLKAEREEIRKAAADEAEKRSKIAAGLLGNPIDSDTRKEHKTMENTLDSLEYRKAFMEFARTGVMAPEFRSVAMTAGNSAVIPPTTLNTIIEKLESYGNILPLVSYMNYPAGVAVPTSELASPATWTSETDLATKGAAVDGKVTGSVTFSAFPLVKAIGLSFMAQVQSLAAFEAAIANNVSAAMAKALEAAIINGTGNGQPTGILNAKSPAATVALSTKLGFADIIKIKQAIPSAYRTGAVLCLNESTFYDFMGITDNNGQPIARVNFGVSGEPEYQLFGTRVVTTDHLPALATASASAKIGFVVQLDKYVVNTAHSADLVTYVDQATRNKVYQSFAAVDGKLVDSNGLVVLTAPAGK